MACFDMKKSRGCREAARNARSLSAADFGQLTVTFDEDVLAKAPQIPGGVL